MLRRSSYTKSPLLTQTQPQHLVRTDIHPVAIRSLKPTMLSTNKSWFQYPIEIDVKSYDNIDVKSIRGMWHLPSMNFLKLPYYYLEDSNKQYITSNEPSLLILGLDPFANRNFYYLYHGYVNVYGNLYMDYDKLRLLNLTINY